MKLNFRLSTLMVFTTLVALALAVVILSRRNAELKSQVDFLSSELGYLVIDNPDHIHAVNINRQGDVVRWRVHIPQSGQYEAVGHAHRGVQRLCFEFFQPECWNIAFTRFSTSEPVDALNRNCDRTAKDWPPAG